MITIRLLERKGEFEELYSYLINLVKHDNNPMKYENEFSRFLESSEWLMRKASVFCLLFSLKLKKQEYRDKAIEFINNPSEDEEVRLWSASGLSVAYKNTQDRDLYKILFDLINDPDENEEMKLSFLKSSLLIYGLDSRDFIIKTDEVFPSLNKIKKVFNFEIERINEVIN